MVAGTSSCYRINEATWWFVEVWAYMGCCLGGPESPNGLLIGMSYGGQGVDSSLCGSREKMGGGAHFLKRIPRIKFPQRHPKSSTSGSASQTQDAPSLGTDVPAPPKNPGVGGKASLQPERTPLTAREIDAIILGGCF